MAIKSCKECGEGVSTSARQCPHCGKKYPTGGFTIPAKIGLGVIVLAAIGQIANFGPNTSPSATGEAADVSMAYVSPVGGQPARATRPAMSALAIASLQDSIKKVLSHFRHTQDRVEGTDYYYDKASPVYLNSRSDLSLYIVKDGNDVSLRLRNIYYADEWLFIQSYAVNADGLVMSLNSDNVERDSNSKIWEWTDQRVNSDDAVILAIANGKSVLIKYDGRQYSKTRTVTSREKNAMLSVLRLYGMMHRLARAT